GGGEKAFRHSKYDIFIRRGRFGGCIESTSLGQEWGRRLQGNGRGQPGLNWSNGGGVVVREGRECSRGIDVVHRDLSFYSCDLFETFNRHQNDKVYQLDEANLHGVRSQEPALTVDAEQRLFLAAAVEHFDGIDEELEIADEGDAVMLAV
ncbi:hypothetical protein BDK51DRAFT_25935, partial [Blyttiomyces helicus]